MDGNDNLRLNLAVTHRKWRRAKIFELQKNAADMTAMMNRLVSMVQSITN